MSTPVEPQAFHLRPRFHLESDKSPAELTELFALALQKGEVAHSGKIFANHVTLFPKAEDRHYWSPFFSLHIESSEAEEGPTIIEGHYGPFPEIWTMFVFFYAIIGLLILIASVIGFANRSVGESSAILWAVPMLAILFGSMYMASYLGQRKGIDQVKSIYLSLERIINSES